MPESNPSNSIKLSDLGFIKNSVEKRHLLALTFELTHRCNNNCVHCYINRPEQAPCIKDELNTDEIKNIIDQAHDMGTLWVLLSGGEPLLRDDFCDIYVYLKKKGFLVSVYTNAALVTDEHIKLFKKYPPRDIEVTLYGITEKIHKQVTRKNTFNDTIKGIEKLLSIDGLNLSFKTTVMKSNVKEFDKISNFCRTHSKNPFRFDPFLCLRLDRDLKKNKIILKEWLDPEDIINLEKQDPKRLSVLEGQCTRPSDSSENDSAHLFRCLAGTNAASIDCFGHVKLCSSMVRKGFTFSLKETSLSKIWKEQIPDIRNKTSENPNFLNNCRVCDKIDLCMWCPAHADLETNFIDEPVESFCDMAFKRYSHYQVNVK